MAYNNQQQQQYQNNGAPQTQYDVVSGEQYRYALQNFRIAHEKVEEQRQQLQEQERQVALLRARIASLEGSDQPQSSYKQNGTIDDFTIKTAASRLEKLMNQWAAAVISNPPVSLEELCQAAFTDIAPEIQLTDPQPTAAQSLLRHCISEASTEGIINCLLVTDSFEANVQLTRIHEHIFARDPTVACVWRKQTFSAAVESCSPEMMASIMADNMPTISKILNLNAEPSSSLVMQVLEAAYQFSRMLHAASTSAGSTVDAFYRAFVPEHGSALFPGQIELVRRCLKSEHGEIDIVGACVFPGLVKVTRGPRDTATVQTVVRRAQVICECALGANVVRRLPQ